MAHSRLIYAFGWTPFASRVFILPPCCLSAIMFRSPNSRFSPSCVTLALRHIYSGESSLPAGESAEEVAALADMLALDGLKDVVALHLRAEKCHYFHKVNRMK